MKDIDNSHIEEQRTIAGYSFLALLLKMLLRARKNEDKQLISEIEKLAWLLAYDSAELPLDINKDERIVEVFSDIGDEIPFSNDAIEKELQRIEDLVRKINDDRLKLNKKKYPEVYKNN